MNDNNFGPDVFIASDILYGRLHQLDPTHYLDERHFSRVTAWEGKNTTKISPEWIKFAFLPFLFKFISLWDTNIDADVQLIICLKQKVISKYWKQIFQMWAENIWSGWMEGLWQGELGRTRTVIVISECLDVLETYWCVW